MTPVQKSVLLSLHSQGLGYKAIASKLGISVNTVKSYCRSHSERKPVQETTAKQESVFCKSCGKELTSTEHKKQKQFCSDKCRVKYWDSHKTGKSKYKTECLNCGKLFDSTHKGRLFCSHECYIQHRFYGGTYEA